MGKKFDFEAAKLQPGKLVPIKLNMLPGHPVVWVEHLGETNKGYWNETLAMAGSGGAEAGSGKRTPETVKADIEKHRKSIERHAIRKLDAKHTDTGEAATQADIPEFCEAIPDDVVETVYWFSRDPENFRKHSFSNAADLAEK